MKIKSFDTSKKVLVVAEIGNNHEGNIANAQELVRQAAAAGVDAVKFQTFKTEQFVSRQDTDRFARLRSFELPQAHFRLLAEQARALGLLFLSTPLDLESATFLIEVADAVKIASGDLTFYPLIRRLAESNRPLIISTGASDLDLVERTLAVVREVRGAAAMRQTVTVLQCVSAYPVPDDEVNLRAIPILQAATGLSVGYSDHTRGTLAALGAVALGARVIEKHFTLDKHFSDFRDHQLSADLGEMRSLVEQIRALSLMLGEATKTVQPCESSMIALIRRSIVAVHDMPAGHLITGSDLTWLRPAGGLAPGDESAVVGRRLLRDIAGGVRIATTDVE